MDTSAITVDLTVLRCGACRRVYFDADVRLFGGCPHCGALRSYGSGRTTQEEDKYLEARALKLYEKYRDLELKCIEERIAKGLPPKAKYTGPRREFGVELAPNPRIFT